MKVSITNFRGITAAELIVEVGRPVLITGPNGSGKSSCAQALQAVLSGEPIPLSGLRKSDAGMLVHAGAGKALVEAEAADGSWRTSVRYPSARVESTGRPVPSSVYALGLVDLTTLEPRKQAVVLLDYLKALPDANDLAHALSYAKMTAEQLAKLWESITTNGWDVALRLATEKGQRAKGQWEAITGERYGSQKGEGWTPDGWESGLELASEESLTASLTQSREFLEAAIAVSAVSDEKRAELERLAETVDQCAVLAEEATKHAATLEREAKSLRDAFHALPEESKDEQTKPCPHCSGAVVVRGGTLAKPSPRDPAEDARRAKARHDARVELDKAHAQRNDAYSAQHKAQAALSAARTAKAELKDLPPPGAATSDEQLEAAREGVRRDETRLAAFKRQREAAKIHDGLRINGAVIEQLKPEGLRLLKLREALRAFNERLSAICARAEWPRVDLDESLTVSFGGRPLVLLSASERFRASVTVQLALAEIDQSPVVVIDAADILDSTGRNALMRLLRRRIGSSVMCCTMQTQPPPTAGRPPVWRRYWLEMHTAHDVTEAGT